jgi:flagellar hook-basal body complex protein FliE
VSIPLIAPVTVPAVAPLAGPAAASAAAAPAGAAASSGAGFASELSRGLDWLQRTHSTADDLAVKAATGDLTDVHDYMIASTQASLATELTVAVRNKAVDAFNEIMRMQA